MRYEDLYIPDFMAEPDWRRRPTRERLVTYTGGWGIDPDSALAALETLYPPEVCEDLILRGQSYLILPLYEAGFVDETSRVMFLGADLATCEGWANQPKLRDRLRDLETYRQARFEVGLWAGMRRAGIQATNVPARNDRKSADFLLHDGLSIALEAKVVSASNYTRNVDELREAIKYDSPTGVITPESPPSLHDVPYHTITFTPSKFVYSVLPTMPPDAFRETIADRVYEGVQAWYCRHARQLVPGMTGSVDKLGEFSIGPYDNGWSFGVMEDEEQERKGDVRGEVARALAHAAHASDQVAVHPADLRAVAIWIPAWNAPVHAAGQLVAEIVGENPEGYRPLDWIVLVNVHRLASLNTRVDVAVCPVPGGRPVSLMTWLGGIQRWRLCQ